MEIGSDNSVLVKLGDGWRFLVLHGSRIILQATGAIDCGELETHLSSVIAGVLLHQRDELALHASAVAIDGAAVAFAGASGLGKSTIASALTLHGHPLLADDVCRVQFDAAAPMVLPGPPRLRLWPDIALALGKAPEQLATARANHPKRLLTDIVREPVARPLRVIIRLGFDPRLAAPSLEPLHGAAALMPIDELVYRTRLGRHLGRNAGIFTKLMRLGDVVSVFRLLRPEGPPDLPRLVALVEEAVRESR
jgi:hypothetical protein